jgi:hypothetical protein
MVPITKLQGITISKHPESQELVLHIQNEHDLRIKSDK